MKLKNKYTKKIDNWCIDKDVIRTCDGSIVYHTIAELIDAGWEDYEEPKEHYFITEYGEVFSLNEYEGLNNVANPEDYKQIGNYFETKEEAERAVEKLKAWKRLKDKGFRFSKDWVYRYDQPKVENHTYFEFVAICEDGILFDDLDLLFGGEE